MSRLLRTLVRWLKSEPLDSCVTISSNAHFRIDGDLEIRRCMARETLLMQRRNVDKFIEPQPDYPERMPFCDEDFV